MRFSFDPFAREGRSAAPAVGGLPWSCRTRNIVRPAPPPRQPTKTTVFFDAALKDRRTRRRKRYTLCGLTRSRVPELSRVYVCSCGRPATRRRPPRRRSGRTTTGRNPLQVKLVWPPAATEHCRFPPAPVPVRHAPHAIAAASPHRTPTTDEAANRDQRNEDSIADVNGYRQQCTRVITIL
jgi:hypothetical protein